jgi:hypothetical protein
LRDGICENGIEMAKELAHVSEQLKKWRAENKLSQAQATKVLNTTGLPVSLDSRLNWQIGRNGPSPLAAIALAEFLNRNPKIRPPATRRKKRNE